MMGESCLCINPDFNNQYLLKEKIVIAYESHGCTECGGGIAAGDRYELAQLVVEGDIYTYRTCIPCKNMRDNLFECGWFYTQIWEDLEEHFRDILPVETEDDEDDDYEWLLG